jgi:large subunit ribosomal protein L17
MRHRKKTNHLSRQHAHRKAMLANMASSLILHKRITTTTAKAKELRTFVEPLITRSKEDSTHSRRMVFKQIRDKYAVSELFREVATKVGERPGGYTRIIKLGNRLGDNADMCIIELVDYNENLLTEKAAATKSKTSRRRRGSKKKATVETAGAAVTAEVEETGTTVEETTEPTAEEAAEEVTAQAEPEAEKKEELSVGQATAEETEAQAAAEAETGDAAEISEEGTDKSGEQEAKKDTDKEEKKEE